MRHQRRTGSSLDHPPDVVVTLLNGSRCGFSNRYAAVGVHMPAASQEPAHRKERFIRPIIWTDRGHLSRSRGQEAGRAT